MSFTETEREALKLKAEGHAIHIALVYDHKGKRESSIIDHYVTCEKCAQIKRERGRP